MADDQQPSSSQPGSSQSRREREREIDRLALDGTKSDYQERTAPAASDPVSDDERRGLNVMGQSDPRGDGAINGVSDTNAGDVHAAAPIIARPGEHRVSPPVVDDPGIGDGGIGISGGAAGGA